jgi:hypothetical protein
MEHDAKMTGLLKIIALPALKRAWLVFTDGEIVPTEVAAIGIPVQQVTIYGDRELPDRRGVGERVDLDYVLEMGTRMYFLVLPPDAGNWDNLWIEHDKVFFDSEAAHAAAANRKKV